LAKVDVAQRHPRTHGTTSPRPRGH
jgi:hypothetical protein